MRAFTFLTFTAIFLSSSALPVEADEKSKQASITQLMDIVQPVQTGQRLRESILKKNEQRSVQSNPMLMKLIDVEASIKHMGPDEKAALVQRMQAAQQERMKRMNDLMGEELKDLDVYFGQTIPKLYDKYFTEKEIQDLITFYKSPTGHKLLDTQSKMTEELNTMSSQLTEQKMAKVMERMMSEGPGAGGGMFGESGTPSHQTPPWLKDLRRPGETGGSAGTGGSGAGTGGSGAGSGAGKGTDAH